MSEDGERLEVARIMVNHATTAHMHTGNIINWHMLKKRLVSHKSSDELYDSLKSALEAWTKSLDPMTIEDPLSTVDIANHALVKKMGNGVHKRDKLKISVKLFLTQWRPEIILQAVNKVCKDLDVKRLDAVLISFPFQTTDEELNNNNNNNNVMPEFEKIKKIWRELEGLTAKGIISHIGVCDFDAASLAELHKWAKVKPTIDQISMTNCCTAPEDLIAFSREHDIELLSHNDDIEMLSPRSFQKLMSDSLQETSNQEWQPVYIARYSVIVRCRGIVEGKGYMVGAERISGNENEDYRFF